MAESNVRPRRANHRDALDVSALPGVFVTDDANQPSHVRRHPSHNVYAPPQTSPSPVPIINEFSDQSHQSKMDERQPSAAKRQRRRDSPTDFAEFGFDGRLEEAATGGGLLADNAAAFALHQSANNMHMANMTLKTRVSRLLCDNQQLNQRVDSISQKNHVLELERERLLTTIQNTSMMLQSTVGTLTQEREPPPVDPLRFQLEQVKAKSLESLSDDSDSLERSTKYTIREFDNLLSALHGHRDNREKKSHTNLVAKASQSNELSQYDVIVKWLNNKTDPQHSVGGPTPSESGPQSSTIESVRDEETGQTVDSVQAVETVTTTDVEKNSGPITFEEKPESRPQPPNNPIAISAGENAICVRDHHSYQQPIIEDTMAPRDDNSLVKPAMQDVPNDSQIPTTQENELADADDKLTVEDIIFGESAVWLGLDESVRPPDEEKTEFLQSWLEDLKTRMHRFKESRRSSLATTQHQGATSKHSEDEHEEFIELCNTMINRMDSMISKTHHADQRDPESGQIMNFLLNEGNSLNLKYSPRRRSAKGKRSQRELRPHRDAGSTSSSDLSWADLANAEKDKPGFRTFQKCLANLEEMNLRRTNNALTQTLIIKALRKLMARQCCRLANESEPTEAVERNDVASSVSEDKDVTTAVGQQTGDSRPGAGRDMYDVINNVSKSIIYQDLGDGFAMPVDGDPWTSQLPPPPSPKLLMRRQPQQKQQWPTALERQHSFDAANTSKIFLELKRLEMEKQKPIPLCWFYLVLVVTLSQSGILRLLKYFGSLLLKL